MSPVEAPSVEGDVMPIVYAIYVLNQYAIETFSPLFDDATLNVNAAPVLLAKRYAGGATARFTPEIADDGAARTPPHSRVAPL
jgi:hypothetical protein